MRLHKQMKKLIKSGLLVALCGSLFLSACAGSYYVSEQPVEPVYEHPAPPYQGAIWIDGEWAYSGGRYVYANGHWDKPREGHAYIRGNWEHASHGYRWHGGHWK